MIARALSLRSERCFLTYLPTKLKKTIKGKRTTETIGSVEGRRGDDQDRGYKISVEAQHLDPWLLPQVDPTG
jgi:hypothetical protein